MITSDKRIKQENFGNITDYSAIRPKGMKRFYAYAHFTDMSYCLLSNIFTATRTAALKIALDRFADCTEYLAASPSTATTEPHSRLPASEPRLRGFFLVYLPDFE